MSRTIQLTRGFQTVVDDEDFEWLTALGSWHAHGPDGEVYAVSNQWVNGKYVSRRMHRLLIPGALKVDHVNGDTLDNRRQNLRPADEFTNAWNRKLRSDSSSGLKGVQPTRNARNPWKASIQVRGVRTHLGVFPTAAQAAVAYDRAAADLFGDFARLNFPKD